MIFPHFSFAHNNWSGFLLAVIGRTEHAIDIWSQVEREQRIQWKECTMHQSSCKMNSIFQQIGWESIISLLRMKLQRKNEPDETNPNEKEKTKKRQGKQRI